MKFPASLIPVLGALALVSQATVAASPVNPEPGQHKTMTEEIIAEGYEIFVPTFTGNFGPNGETLSFNGTIQEVMEQVRAINPDYDWEASVDETSGIHARDEDDWRDREVKKKDCKIGDWAKGYYISDGIKYLRKVPKDTAKMNKKGCGRVSCSWNAAIFVCWDPDKNSPKKYEKSWDYVADYAQNIAEGDYCPRYDSHESLFVITWVRGKLWDSKGMAVRVGFDKC